MKHNIYRCKEDGVRKIGVKLPRTLTRDDIISSGVTVSGGPGSLPKAEALAALSKDFGGQLAPMSIPNAVRAARKKARAGEEAAENTAVEEEAEEDIDEDDHEDEEEAEDEGEEEDEQEWAGDENDEAEAEAEADEAEDADVGLEDASATPCASPTHLRRSASNISAKSESNGRMGCILCFDGDLLVSFRFRFSN